MIAEETPEGILLRPAITIALELYSAERKAEFILSNAVDAEDYARAREEVLRLGLVSFQGVRSGVDDPLAWALG